MDSYDSIDYNPNVPYSDFDYVNVPIKSNVKIGQKNSSPAASNEEQFNTQIPPYLKTGLQQHFNTQIPPYLKTGLQQHMTDFGDNEGIMMPTERLMLYFIIFVLIISVAIMQMNFTYRMYKLARRTIHETK